MTSQIISQNLVKFFSVLLECCCDTVIAPMCEDNISQLQDRVKTDRERIPRSSDLSDREVFVWMKKLANLKKHSEVLLRRNESRAGPCSFVLVAFDNFEAAKYLQRWDKLDEEEPVPAVPAMPADSTSTHQLTHESTAPVGAMDTQLTIYQEMGNVIRGRHDGNYDLANRKPWVLDSLGILEGNQFARDLVSTPRKAVGDVDGAAVVQSMHGTRLIRSKSFEIIHEERVLIFDKRSLVNYHEHY